MYKEEAVTSLGGHNSTVEFSWHLQTLKMYLQTFVDISDDQQRKRALEGLKQIFLSIEEHIFFPNDDEYGGKSLSVKKIKKKLKKHGIKSSVTPPDYHDIYNILCWLFNVINADIIGEEECMKLQSTGKFQDLFLLFQLMFNDILAMIRTGEWIDVNELAEHYTKQLQNN